MPPKKSNSSTAAPAGDETLNESIISNSTPSTSKQKEQSDGVSVEDLLLPRTLTHRLAKGVLPPNTSIHRDALLAMTKAATVFISYLSHTANDLTVKKTIGPNDVLAAIKETEFEAFLPRLERELEAYATVVAGKRKGYRMKVKERESVGAEGSKEGEDGPNGIDGEEDAERGAKRQRMDGERSGDDFEDASHLLNGASGSDTLGHDGPRHSGYDGAGEGSEGDTLEDEAALDQELDEADGDVGDETQDEEEDLGEEDQDDVDEGYGPGAQLRAAMEDVDDGLDDTGEESD